MKKILFKYTYALPLLFFAAVIVFISSCEDKMEVDGPPVIKEVRNYAASPDDTTITSLNDGQWVVLLGENLSAVTHLYFAGVEASINNTLFTDKSIVVQVPSIPFLSVPRDQLNIVTAVSEGGMTNFEIKVTGSPIIAYVRNSSADNEIIDMVFPEQEINIVGVNLENATSIAFQGVEADLSNVVYTDSSAIVQVPSNLSGGDATLVNMITYTTNLGSGNFGIRIVGPPIVTRVSYEIPNEGDTVFLYGYNFVSVESITFAGETISSFEESEDGNSVMFVSPKLTGSGPVEVVTPGGFFTSAFKVNDIDYINTGGLGIIGNMEWGSYFGWGWGNGNVALTSSDPNSGWPSYNADYGVGTGMYLVYKSNPLASGESGYLDDWGGNQIAMGDGGGDWVPTENLSDAGDKWALKFEIYVKQPWSGGTLCIRTEGPVDHVARYEPWKVGNKSVAYTTEGWQTVTIPLSSFRLDEGAGDPISKVSDLFDVNKAKVFMRMYLKNFGTSTTANIEIAVDNFRVTKR